LVFLLLGFLFELALVVELVFLLLILSFELAFPAVPAVPTLPLALFELFSPVLAVQTLFEQIKPSLQWLSSRQVPPSEWMVKHCFWEFLLVIQGGT